VPLAVLAAAGVKRVSLGGALYRLAMGGLVAGARALREGRFDVMGGAVTGAEVTALLPQR
jgi:2-methylisocitrate lyase-like PEP mutase family enzyme